MMCFFIYFFIKAWYNTFGKRGFNIHIFALTTDKIFKEESA